MGSGRGGVAAGVDGDDNGLGAEGGADLGDELGAGDGGGVDGDLVGAGVEDGGGVFGGADAAADGEGDEEFLGGAADRFEQRAAAFVGGGDVEEDDLVGAGGGVAVGELGGVAGVDDVDELDAFDDAAVPDVEAGDDAFGQQAGLMCGGTPLPPYFLQSLWRSRVRAGLVRPGTRPQHCRLLPGVRTSVFIVRIGRGCYANGLPNAAELQGGLRG